MNNMEVMTVKEVASYIKLHPHTVSQKARKGEIPGKKIGRSWRFQKTVIDEWLSSRDEIIITTT